MNSDYQGMYIIWGPPGTGKTTFLSKQVQEIVKKHTSAMGTTNLTPVLICSLTRTAAAEIGGRDLSLPRQQVSTLHSHGYRSLGCPTLAESKWKEWNERMMSIDTSYWLPEQKQTNADDPEYENRNERTRGQKLLEDYQLNRARMRPRDMWRHDVLRFAKHWEEFKEENDYVDFGDMIEIPLRKRLDPPGNPSVIIADEAQDLSKLELSLLKMWGDKAGALMLAGDPQQALFCWRGADKSFFYKPEDGKRRVLKQSWRVSRSVHFAAVNCSKMMTDYEDAEYLPRDEEGFALEHPDLTYRNHMPLVRMAKDHLAEGKSVMFAASCSYMLDPLKKTLRAVGIPFANPWRMRRGDWNPLSGGGGVSMAERVLSFLRMDSDTFGDYDPDTGEGARVWTNEEVHEWVSVIRSSGNLIKGAKKRIKKASDEDPDGYIDLPDLSKYFKHELVDMLFELFDPDLPGYTRSKDNPRTPALLDWYQSALLPEKCRVGNYVFSIARQNGSKQLMKKPKLYLGTIHSFKGGESDIVFLFPDLSYAGMMEFDKRGEGSDSIYRTFYVGITRAREGVYLCGPVSHDLSVNYKRFLRN